MEYIDNPKKLSERLERRDIKFRGSEEDFLAYCDDERNTSATHPKTKSEGKENDESREESILKEMQECNERGEEIKKRKKKCNELLVTLEESQEKLRELQVALEHLENQSNSILKEEEIKALIEKYKPYLTNEAYHRELVKVVKSIKELDSKYVQFNLFVDRILQADEARRAEERQRILESLKAPIHPQRKPTIERKSKTVTVREKLEIIEEEEEEEETRLLQN